MKFVIASGNRHKIDEISAILKKEVSNQIELAPLKEVGYTEEIEENGTTFEENALIKARVGASLGYYSIADDSGLSVDFLKGEPGIYSARYAGEPCNDENNNEKLLLNLKDVKKEERTAKFVSTIAFVAPDGKSFVVRGECPGEILFEKRGYSGFGYDPLFYYAPLNKTFAELTSDEKNEISHRARAMKLFTEELKKQAKDFKLEL